MRERQQLTESGWPHVDAPVRQSNTFMMQEVSEAVDSCSLSGDYPAS